MANAMHLSAWTGQDIDLTTFDDDLYLAELNKLIEAEDASRRAHRPVTR